MTASSYDEIIRAALYQVAPDIEGQDINPDETFRDLFDIDSMDQLNFVIGLSMATGIDIPESDYPRLESLADCRQYLAERNDSQ